MLDDEGVAKLGDFGLAHILPPGHDDQVTLLLPPVLVPLWVGLGCRLGCVAAEKISAMWCAAEQGAGVAEVPSTRGSQVSPQRPAQTPSLCPLMLSLPLLCCRSLMNALACRDRSGSTTFSGFAADVWALGCVLFSLTSGKLPFEGDDKAEQVYNILNQRLVFPSRIRKDPQLVDLLGRMLDRNPETRITPARALRHEWFDADRGRYRYKR